MPIDKKVDKTTPLSINYLGFRDCGVLFLAWFRVYNEAIAIQIKSLQAEEKHREGLGIVVCWG